MSLPPVPRTGSPAAPLDPRATEAIDAPLAALAAWSGGDHRKFLSAFFSFLHRRTDFYMVPHPDDVGPDGRKTTTMGFAEGDAEKLLLAAFRQFPLRRMPRQRDTGTGGGTAVTSEAEGTKRSPTTEEAMPPKPSETEEELMDPMHGVRYTDDRKQIPVGNGGSTPTFKWTQNLEECTILLPVPPECRRGKDLDVEFAPKRIRIRAKAPRDGEVEPRVFLAGDLTEAIKPGECTWSIEGGIVTLILYKQTRTFWKAVLQGDEEIDTTMVDSRRHIQDYDESTQAQIRKIIHQQSLIHKAERMVDTSKPETIPPPEALPEGVEFMDVQKLN